MRFDDDTIKCEECGREISYSDDMGYEDSPLCSGCSARANQVHVKTPCAKCEKPLGEEPFHYNVDTNEVAHSSCIEILSEEDQELWSNEFD